VQEKRSLLPHASQGEVKVQREGSRGGERVLHISHSEAPDDLDSHSRRTAEGHAGPALHNGAEPAVGNGTDLDKDRRSFGRCCHMHPSGWELERQVGSFGSSRAHEHRLHVPCSYAREPARFECR